MKGSFQTFSHAKLGDVRLHTLSWGEAGQPAVILLHGGGANAHWWDHIAPALAEKRHVIALDFRGHGESDYPQEFVAGAFDVDLQALLDHHGVSETVLIGHSMGAHIAARRAASSSDTRALVLIDIARALDSRQRRRSRLALALRRNYASLEEAIERFQFLPGAPHATPALRDAIARHSVREEQDGRFGYRFDPGWFGLHTAESIRFDQIHCPSLILRGEESEILSAEGARELVETMPRAQLRVIREAGHHVQIDQPAETLAAIQSFLRTLE